MKKFNKRILFFAIPIVFFFALIALYNYTLDPFGVIKGDMSIQKTEPNQRYLKMKHILNNPKKYNAFLFGTSRVGKINVANIDDGHEWYNFTYSQALPLENLTDIKMLLNDNVQVEKILIGLDDMSYLVDPKLHDNQTLRKPYKNANTRFDYIFLKPSTYMYKQIKYADTTRFYSARNYETIYHSGSFIENKKDTFIERNKALHQKDPVFDSPFRERYYYERIGESINEIKEIIRVCKERKIELTFFMNPLHIRTYLDKDTDDYFSFLKQLSQLTVYIDFSGINTVTVNNYNYYETSHFRPFIGDKMIDVIFNEATHNQPFGMLVNKHNIDSLIAKKKVEILHYTEQNLSYIETN